MHRKFVYIITPLIRKDNVVTYGKPYEISIRAATEKEARNSLHTSFLKAKINHEAQIRLKS